MASLIAIVRTCTLIASFLIGAVPGNHLLSKIHDIAL